MRVRKSDGGANLELVGLSKWYGDTLAVAKVFLNIGRGEFMTLLGPSGSGKTTTLNIIAGLLEPSDGDIRVDGRSVRTLAPHKRNIGMVFQNYALFPHMTVFENVAFPLRRRHVKRRDLMTMVHDALEMVALRGLERRHPQQLSGGQQQRVALARALVFRPSLLLMDEPLGALDKKLRSQLQLQIRRLHRSLGVTFVYVTHDQEEALTLADRIAIFNDGRIEQLGTGAELYDNPNSLFVAQFVGESNIFRGPVEGRGRDASLRASGCLFRLPGNAHSVREPAALVVRPEHLVVSPPNGEQPGDDRNSVAGRVVDVMNLGSFRQVQVMLDDGEEMLARQQGRAIDVRPGDLVRLSWHVEDAVLLPDAGRDEGNEASSEGADRRR